MLSRFYISKRIVKNICLITKMVQIVMTLCSITMPTGKTFCFFASTIKKQSYFMLLCYAREGMAGVCKKRWTRILVIFSQCFG